jgi:hypothetical protein
MIPLLPVRVRLTSDEDEADEENELLLDVRHGDEEAVRGLFDDDGDDDDI